MLAISPLSGRELWAWRPPKHSVAAAADNRWSHVHEHVFQVVPDGDGVGVLVEARPFAQSG